MLAICIMLNQFRLNAVHMYALCLETAAPVGPGSMSSLLTQDFNSVQPQQKEINQSKYSKESGVNFCVLYVREVLAHFK